MSDPFANLFERVSAMVREDAKRILGRERAVRSTIHVNVVCERCGNSLDTEIDPMRSHSGYLTLKVRVCDVCLKRAGDDGYDKGYETGVDSVEK